MAAIQNDRDLLLQAAAIRVIVIPLDISGIPGLSEVIAAVKGVKISAPSTVFHMSMGGVYSPTSITFTAVVTAVTGTVIWDIVSGVGTLTSTTGTVTTLNAAAMDTSSITLRARLTAGGITYEDRWTVAKTADGADGVIGVNGTNGDAVDIVFIRSATQPAKPADSLTTPTGWYSSVSAVPAGTTPMWSSVGKRYSAAANYEWNIPIRLEGAVVAEVTVYKRSTVAQATPAGGSYTFSNPPVLSPPAGWSTGIPAGSDPVFTSRAVVSTVAGNVSPVAVTSWSFPVISLQNGTNGANGLGGAPGAPGPRGSIVGYAQLSNLVYYSGRGSNRARWAAGLATEGNAATADILARNRIWNLLGNAGSAANNNHMVIGDTITLSNTVKTITATGYWSGSAWDHPGTVIDGNLLVGGNVSGQEFTGGTFTGGLFRTGIGADRIEIGSVNNKIEVVAKGLQFLNVDPVAGTIKIWPSATSTGLQIINGNNVGIEVQSGNSAGIFTSVNQYGVRAYTAKAGFFGVIGQGAGNAGGVFGQGILNGSGIAGISEAGNGGYFQSNSGVAPALKIAPVTGFPSDKSAGGVCVVGGYMYVADGSNWNRQARG